MYTYLFQKKNRQTVQIYLYDCLWHPFFQMNEFDCVVCVCVCFYLVFK